MENPTNITFSESGDSVFQNVYIYGKLNYDFDNDDITVKSLNITGPSIVNDITVNGNLNVTGSNTKIGLDIVTRNLWATGITTLSSIKDTNGSTGSAGQVLSTDGSDLEWINTSGANVNSASKVGVNDSSDSGDKMYITFVDATSGNEEIRVGTGITYAPSSDKLYVKNIASPAGNLELQAVSGENGIVIKDNNAVELYFDGSATWKLATKSDGVEIRDNLYLADNDTLKFGNGNDLHISHTNALSGQDDSNGDSVLAGDDWASYIKETGAGPLIFKSNGGPSTGAFQFYDTGWRPILKLFSGTSARAALYYAGSEKLITSSTGIDVTGALTATTIVKSGGSSSQFLKADGSVDSSTYLTSFSETDTLDTVCDRGSSTNQNITTSGTLNDAAGNVREIVNNAKTGAYTLTANDVGELINTNSNVTIPSGVFSAGQGVTIYNNSSGNITLSRSGVTAYTVGTTTNTDKTLAQKGLATVMCVSANTFVVLGGGLS